MVEQFRHIPKAELHLHLSGAYPLEYLETIATKEQIQALKTDLEWITQRVDYNACFRVFQNVYHIVNTEEKVERGVQALCKELKNDGVLYAEIRTGLRNLGGGYEAYLQSILNGIESEQKGCFTACVLLSLRRDSTLEIAKKTVDLAIKYKDAGVVGIDISGDSTLGNIAEIIPELQRARHHGLFITLHIGESPNETDQLESLLLIQPHRIGHGVFLTKEAKKWVLENKIPVEICLSSSVLVKMIDDYSLHPWLQEIPNGHPVAICTDDPLIFRTSLSEELNLLAKHGNITFNGIHAIVEASFSYAFAQVACSLE